MRLGGRCPEPRRPPRLSSPASTRPQAVQYFYEPFLAAFDPELRKELGVWYTPPEVVAIHGRSRGPRPARRARHRRRPRRPDVYVLDPCCGTGSYLVEASADRRPCDAQGVRRAGRPGPEAGRAEPGLRLRDHAGALRRRASADRAAAASGTGAARGRARTRRRSTSPTRSPAGASRTSRAPPAVSRVGSRSATRPRTSSARCRSWWSSAIRPTTPSRCLARTRRRAWSSPTKTGLQARWGIRKFNLDDLYVRFFRIAERRCQEQTGRGIVC